MRHIQHHCSDETLMAYASGTLGEALSLVAATHMSVCRTCRERARTAELIGGALIEDCDTMPLSTGALDRTLAMLDEDEDQDADAAPPATEEGKGVPAPLSQYLAMPLEAVPWRGPARGVKTYALKTGGKQTAKLLKIAPGYAIPEHGHRGNELTLVLKGAYRDELGRFGPGDVADMDVNAHHQPVAESDEDCICLIAIDAPLRFDNPALRLIRPFLGV